MTRILTLTLITVLAFGPLPLRAAGDPALLEIRVVEGDGVSYAAGSRATRGVTVLVIDETGKPVEGATVAFQLPPDGPGGVFASGTRTEIATTRTNGQAAAWGMQWNQLPGPFEMRITAVKGPARAGTTTSLYLTAGGRPAPRAAPVDSSAADATTAPEARAAVAAEATVHNPGRSGRWGGHKWVWITVGLAGAAMAGAGVASRQSSSSTATPTGVQIGSPTIVLGRQ